ncbi:MAG TPA: dephospho-CoA kinase [Pyrinomonadaceae bacterium]|nr:dephospho-CoA kinase [Pyrinomonadaceae bacterium]
MLRVGLTGSIGVGKSFVAGVLRELGCHVLDADQTAREVVTPGAPGLTDVVKAFGKEVLHRDGTLDRQRLGALIFGSDEKRTLLNSILHPYIIARQDQVLRDWERQDPDGIAVVDAALMIESGGYKCFDKLIVVHCNPEEQLRRIMARDSLSREEAERRVGAQMSQAEKKKYADYLIDTSGGFEATRHRTQQVYENLVAISEQPSKGLLSD